MRTRRMNFFNGNYNFNESNVIKEYKLKSKLYNAVKTAAAMENLSEHYKNKMASLEKATTIFEMVTAAREFANKTGNQGEKLLSIKKDFHFYASQLEDDIIHFAVKKGYYEYLTDPSCLTPKLTKLSSQN